MTDRTDLPRRRLFRHLCCGAGLALAATGAPALAAAPSKKTEYGPDEALKVLKEGNQKFLSDSGPGSALTSRQRRLEIARGQAPFAVLVSCADSRVPPELLFGRGLGELFIVRNAGNTVDTVALGSIEYAVAELGVPLIVVMGHERCGAVDAAVSLVEKHTSFPGSIGQMIEPIVPAVLRARAEQPNASRDEWLDQSVRANVTRVVERLRNSEALLRDAVRAGKVKVVGARYDLDDGKVDFFAEGA